MRKIIPIAVVFILTSCLGTVAQAQLSDSFNKELMALIRADIKEVKGKEIENQQELAHIYASKLKLSGFEVTYSETKLGNELRAKYLQTGSDELMDALAEKFIELPFTRLDSKKDKKVLGIGMFASSLKRRIKLVNLENKVFLIAELDNNNNILLFFNS